MASILIFSERDELAFELLGKAGNLSGPMGLEVAAAVFGPADPKEYQRRGAAKVLYSNREQMKSFEASVYAQAMVQAARAADASLILVSSTRRGKELAGRLAQKMNAGCLMDVKSLEFREGRLIGVRNSFGGATEAIQTILTKIQVIAVVPRSFEPASADGGGGAIVDLKLDLTPSRVRMVKRSEKDVGAVDIEGAEVLVCVGKGLAKQEDLKMVEELAGALGGIVACTKPVATDLKWLPESRMIGLSGKKGKPGLALCLGISGQVQFTVGIRDAKIIMAINTDPNAYI
ncbi:MAG TPA: electron transfer flavoprotein subunit alpha/FixB family protein, partial [Thermodesulfobacteriota bacterium]|nr:electron transfer flavoprotein subunit alpha/FixB family protein [Thermodesulfobacteriota bacterium]